VENQTHEHDDSITSIGVELKGDCDLEKLNSWLGNLLKEKGVDIFRMKGVVSVRGSVWKFVFQGIHMLFEGVQSEEKWKDGEERGNKVIFIGRNLDRKELNEGVRGCLYGEAEENECESSEKKNTLIDTNLDLGEEGEIEF